MHLLKLFFIMVQCDNFKRNNFVNHSENKFQLYLNYKEVTFHNVTQ